MKNNSLKSIIVLSAICLVVALLLSAVNEVTAPLIAAAEQKAADGALLEVLPDATEFEAVEGEFPATVTEMKKDLGGSGFAFKLTASSSYSQSPLSIVLGIDNEGKITKMKIVNYAETKGNAADFEALFAGKDATMTDVVAGCTYTTNALKDAVKIAYDVFYEFADIEKSDEQKFQELYTAMMPSGTDKTGSYAMTQIELPEGAPASITAIYQPNTGIGYAMLGKSGETMLAIGVNAYGKVNYLSDLDGNDLLADAAYAQIITDAESAIPSIYTANNDSVIAKMVEKGIIASATEAKTVDFGAVSNRVVAVYKVNGGTAYVANSEGFGGVLSVCYVFADNGAIVKYATLNHSEQDNEYAEMDYGTVIGFNSYPERFNGLTVDTITDDTLLIAGSTFTTTATKQCWNDIKAAYQILNGEAAQ